MNSADIVGRHGTRYSSVTEPPTDKCRVIVMCMEQMQKYAVLPSTFKTRVSGVRPADASDVAKSIRNKSVDYIIVAHREAGMFLNSLPKDVVPIYLWRGSAKSLYDNVYALLGLPDPNIEIRRSESPGPPAGGVAVATSPLPWSEDEEAAIQIAYDKVGAAIVSEMFPIFREALPDGPPRTLQAFLEKCQCQLSGDVTMTRVQSEEAVSDDEDIEYQSLLTAAEQLRATKQAARLENERIAREKAEEARREADRQAKREAAAKVEAAAREAEHLEAEQLAGAREERKRVEKEVAERVLEERRRAEEQAEARRQAAREAEQRAEAALSDEERVARDARQHEVVRGWMQDPGITRNAKCPCGKTDKKFKQCCVQKFAAREAQLKKERDRQMVVQRLRGLNGKGSDDGLGEEGVMIKEVLSELASNNRSTYDKVSAIGLGLVAVHERIEEFGKKPQPKRMSIESSNRCMPRIA